MLLIVQRCFAEVWRPLYDDSHVTIDRVKHMLGYITEQQR